MDFAVKNVHVIPMGLEIDRVIAGLKEYPTNYAIFIYGTNAKLDVEQKARNNGKKIEKMINATVTVKNEFVDYSDFNSAFNKLLELFNELKDERYTIYVNLSSGSHIIGSATLIVSFMTGAIPYYIYPGKYNISKTTTVLSKGYEDIIQLPTMTIEMPGEHEKMVLFALKKKGGFVSKQNELMEILEQESFFPIRKEKEDQKRFLARKRAKLNRTLLNLSKRNFVILKKKGRNVKVTLTPSGHLFSQ
jgi:hypothetical protein